MDENKKYGKCSNYGECDRAGEKFEIEPGQPMECPECHAKLQEVDADGKPVKAAGTRKRKGNKGNLWLLIVGVVIALAAIAFLIVYLVTPEDDIAVMESDGIEQPVEEMPLDEPLTENIDTLLDEPATELLDTVAPVEEPKEEVKEEVKEKKPATGKLSYGNWSGSWKNGQPHGNGTLTYSTSHLIDSRDPKGRVAQPGEYVVGEWDNGHLVQGRWFKNDGTKEVVIVGKAG